MKEGVRNFHYIRYVSNTTVHTYIYEFQNTNYSCANFLLPLLQLIVEIICFKTYRSLSIANFFNLFVPNQAILGVSFLLQQKPYVRKTDKHIKNKCLVGSGIRAGKVTDPEKNPDPTGSTSLLEIYLKRYIIFFLGM